MPRAQRSTLPLGVLIPLLAFTVIFLAVLVWAAAVIWLRPPASPTMPVPDSASTAAAAPTIPFHPATAHQDWQQYVAVQVGSLAASSSPSEIQSVEQDVLNMRVTADDRDADLQLVLALMAFEKAQPGSYADVQHALAVTQQ